MCKKRFVFYAVYIYYSIFDLFGQAFFGKTRLFILQKMLFCGRICLEPGYTPLLTRVLAKNDAFSRVFIFHRKLALLCRLHFYHRSEVILLIW